MSRATTPGWAAVSAVLIATIVVLWVRWKRNRHFAINAAKGYRHAESKLGKTGKPNASWDNARRFRYSAPVSLEVRVLKMDGKSTLLIPLEAGGNELIECSHGIGEIAGEDLKVTIPDWLSDKMGLEEGSRVQIDNKDGKFNFTATEAAPEYTRRN
jgi:hypothetical protein